MDKQINFLPIFDVLDANIEQPIIEDYNKVCETCPICESEVIRNGRCKTCYYCGWSSCDL